MTGVQTCALPISDEHDPRYMGVCGNPIVKTPNLDRLAARSAHFTNVYTPSPICVPARAAMATGDYVHRIGRTGRAGRSGVAVTLAEACDIISVRGIERFINSRIPEEQVEGLEPRGNFTQAPRGGGKPGGGRGRSGGGGYAGNGGGRSEGRSFGGGERKTYGDKPSFGDRKPFEAREERSFGERKSYGDKPAFGERKSYGDRPAFGERKSFGDKPAFGERKSFGDRKPYEAREERSFGDRKPFVQGEERSFGDRKPFGERKSFGDKPSFGDRKPFGERKSFGDKPSFGDRKPSGFSGNSDAPKKWNRDAERPSFPRSEERARPAFRAEGTAAPSGPKREHASDRKSTRLNSSHMSESRMPSSA